MTSRLFAVASCYPRAQFPVRGCLVLHARRLFHAFFGLVLLMPAAITAQQQTTGTPCSPAAPTTIDGRYLPNPPPPFGGEINLNAKNSKPCWPAKVVPP